MTPDALIPGSSAALALLDAEMTRQAATIAYVSDFYLMMWVVLALIPFVFLLDAPAKAAAPASPAPTAPSVSPSASTARG